MLIALDNAFGELLAYDGPGILDIMINRMELVMPPHVELGQVASTALYSAKTALSGRMGELVDMVRTDFLSRWGSDFVKRLRPDGPCAVLSARLVCPVRRRLL